jgi:hypothetical protein
MEQAGHVAAIVGNRGFQRTAEFARNDVRPPMQKPTQAMLSPEGPLFLGRHRWL